MGASFVRGRALIGARPAFEFVGEKFAWGFLTATFVREVQWRKPALGRLRQIYRATTIRRQHAVRASARTI